MKFREKIISLQSLPIWRERVRDEGKKLVVTNGCFDLLHLGHVTYLETARGFGDLLLVGLNADASVKELKGPDRPINPEADRAAVIGALASVDAVCIFPERTAAAFLARAKPDVYVKGGDYTVETLNREERQIVERAGGVVHVLPVVPGRSTSELLKKIASL